MSVLPLTGVFATLATEEPPEPESVLSPEEHYEKLYTDENALNEAAQDPAFKQAEKYSLDPKALRYSALNQAYLATFAGRDLSPSEYGIVRDRYSEETFGKKAGTDQEFYTQVQGQFITQQKRRQAASELYTGAVKQAVDDELQGTSTSTVEAFQKWKDKNRELVEADDELEFFTNGRRIVQQAKEDIRSVAPHAARVWQSLMKYNEGEASEQDIHDLGAELAAMPRDARKKAIRYGVLAAQDQTGDTGPILQAAMNLEKSIQRSFGWMEDLPPLTLQSAGGILPLSIPVLAARPLADIEAEAHNTLMRLKREGGVEINPDKQAEFAKAKQALEMTNVVRDLKEAARTQLDPVRPIMPEGTLLGTAERGVYGAGGSAGFMLATAVSPLLGLYAIASQEYDDMRRENPDMNPHAAGAAALVSGSIQTVLEMAQIRTFGGIGLALRNIKNGVLAAAGKAGIGLTKENAQEAGQDAVSAGIPLLMSHLRDDMPDQDTYKIMKSYVKERGEVFFSTLALVPFGIAGSRLSEGDIVADRTLAYLGFDNKQREKILSSPNRQAAYSAEIGNRSEKNIKKGLAMQAADAQSAKAFQENAELPTLESEIQPDGTREYRVVRNPPPDTGGPQYLTPEEMAGQSVTVSTTDPVTNNVVITTMPAAEAQSLVKRSVDAYSALIDCLLKT